ncbi:hypothetical protein JCM16303_006711 [Sporobolomyces ruberrimus]
MSSNELRHPSWAQPGGVFASLGPQQTNVFQRRRGTAYEEMTRQIANIATRWGGSQELESGWKPNDWAVDFTECLTEETWVKLGEQRQALVLDRLREDRLPSDIYSSKFPSPPLLRYRVGKGIPSRPPMPPGRTAWLRTVMDNEVKRWFGLILDNLKKRQYDKTILLRLFREELGNIKPISLSPPYLRHLTELKDLVEKKWDGFEGGNDTRRSWVAAYRTVAVMSRLVADPRHSGIWTQFAEYYYYPTRAFLLKLCGFKLPNLTPIEDVTPGPSHASSAFTPVSRSAIRRTLLKRACPRPAVGRLGNLACHDNRLDTSDNIRIAVGRICLAYTLRDEDLREDGASNEGNLSHCSDPGLAAFRQLEWMVLYSTVRNKAICPRAAESS